MKHLSDETSAWLASLRKAHDPPARAKDRSRHAISTRIAAGAGAVATTTAATTSLAGATKVIVGLALLASAGTYVREYDAHRRRPVAVSSAATAPATSLRAIPPSSSNGLPADEIGEPLVIPSAVPSFPPRPEGPPHAPPVSASPNSPSASSVTSITSATGTTNTTRATSTKSAVSEPERAPSISAEVDLLRSARAASRDGDESHALQLLDEHARRFPAGALAEEREAARVHTLCALGRVAEAVRAATSFAGRFPKSPLLGAIRSSCASSEFAIQSAT
jgi:hypothetical protein